ncbi:MAG: NrdH-redoxin [Gammaproteobacteria bacterium]|nr:NrdH-redoxin [Gammaproteobacteria bacterium]
MAQPTRAAVLEVFVRDGCPHCADAKAYLPQFGAERPWLTIVYRPVDTDRAARDDLERHSRAAGIWPPGVPTFVIDGRVLVGFGTAADTGPALAALVAHSVSGAAVGDGAPQQSKSIETRWFGTLSAERFGLPLFTLALGLLDGFNPCAMWVLLFLLSLLIHLRDRRRMAWIAGTFVVASGAVYYAFMAAWLNVFLLVGFSAAVRWTLALAAIAIGAVNVKDYFAFGRGVSLSIPAAAKPGLYQRMRDILQARSLLPALAGVAVLAVVVNFIEILCTAGLPAIYTAVLAQHELSVAARHGYLLLYIAGYITDDTLMVATAVIALGSNKLTERTGRQLKLVSGLVMLALGLVLALRPEWVA